MLFPEDSYSQDPLQRRDLTVKALEYVVRKLVDISTPRADSPGGSTVKGTVVDTVQEYARDTLSLGLLYMEFTDRGMALTYYTVGATFS